MISQYGQGRKIEWMFFDDLAIHVRNVETVASDGNGGTIFMMNDGREVRVENFSFKTFREQQMGGMS